MGARGRCRVTNALEDIDTALGAAADLAVRGLYDGIGALRVADAHGLRRQRCAGEPLDHGATLMPLAQPCAVGAKSSPHAAALVSDREALADVTRVLDLIDHRDRKIGDVDRIVALRITDQLPGGDSVMA